MLLAERPIPVWKRVLDLTLCLLALPLVALALLLMAAVIVVVSPGPVFFRQERVGYMGRRFILYKFRTMRVGADDMVHRAHFSALVNGNRPMQKLDAARDARLIPGGRLLRALGLDELPQLFNVIRGDMSLVGPRPCIPYEYEQYSPRQRARFSTVPGLTGLWQVSGKNRTTFDEMIQLDIKYSQAKTFWLDLKIIALTLPALWIQVADTRLQRKIRAHGRVGASAPGGGAPTFQT
jgi:lipopolysaccharide/colanic/teichoic acid biosynthesis glycosyltransferase